MYVAKNVDLHHLIQSFKEHGENSNEIDIFMIKLTKVIIQKEYNLWTSINDAITLSYFENSVFKTQGYSSLHHHNTQHHPMWRAENESYSPLKESKTFYTITSEISTIL